MVVSKDRGQCLSYAEGGVFGMELVIHLDNRFCGHGVFVEPEEVVGFVRMFMVKVQVRSDASTVGFSGIIWRF